MSLLERILAVSAYEKGILTSSVENAVACAILPCLKSGDHVVYCSDVMNSTTYLFESVLSSWGIETNSVSPNADSIAWESFIKENTRLLFFATPTTYSLRILDIEGIVRIARRHNLLVIVNNYQVGMHLLDPSLHGVDATVCSVGSRALKAGVILSYGEYIDTVNPFVKALNLDISSINTRELSREWEIHGLEAEQRSNNALRLARFLQDHPRIAAVRYPHLTTHPEYKRAYKQMKLGGSIVVCNIIATNKNEEQLTKTIDFLDAEMVTAKAKGIEQIKFLASDVVRHPLVGKIVHAYEKDTK